jgi:hypothetical protein
MRAKTHQSPHHYNLALLLPWTDSRASLGIRLDDLSKITPLMLAIRAKVSTGAMM